MLHDEGIALTWPGIEPVPHYDCLDLNRFDSAVERPFGSGFGIEYYPTLYDKAACLFHAFVADHIFVSGNKRTAVLVLDQFLLANGVFLLLDNESVRQLANDTVPEALRARGEDHRATIERLSELFRENSVTLSVLEDQLNAEDYAAIASARNKIIEDPRNAPGAKLKQTPLRGRFGIRRG